MAIIDPEGLFNGDRLRRCSNAAQLHWPRLFLASDGFARLEINYARIIGKAYATFSPVPSETELQSYLQEYAKNYLLFIYESAGQLWGQWDTRSELLPRYKTAQDRRSPIPPEPAFSQWKQSYRSDSKAFPKSFGNISETFLHGVGVGVGKNTCASTSDARVTGSLPPIDNPAFSTLEPELEKTPAKLQRELTAQQDRWFATWWDEYWLHKAKKAAREAFLKHVRIEERFQHVMAATRAQKTEMLSRESNKRPHGATWLNGERWEDETVSPASAAAQDDYPEF